MFRIKDEYLNDLETNPWKRLRNRIIRVAVSPYHLVKSIFMFTGALVWFAATVLFIYVFTLLESLPHFEQNGFAQAKQAATESVQVQLKDNPDGFKQYKWVGIDQINRELLYAIVMSEDGDFFTHQGIDYDALISALGENIKRREWSFGASTITQQTVKNIYLENNKTLYRKLKELLVTKRLEQALSKNEILELYLNIVEFGPDIYGVEQAAQYYFKQPASKLNAAQGAFLAILMPSPRKYHFTVYQNQYLAKRHKRKYRRILQDMRFKEYISPVQYQKYLNWRFF
ncbi:MAG: monofunctional biosynthetic peptidoglycan transglycosylase [Gammaproteobacteria bacterium]|nr:monofunctional biosynthetic peptidoglycan transglycosylase [Gammaproteobacteria bacterium]